MDIILEDVPALEVNTLKLHEFLDAWDESYKNAMKEIPLFNPELTEKWNDNQKKYFAEVFYHARGNFHDFLWHMGNHAPDSKAKSMILKNIAEEFGTMGKSHEQLYFDFAASVGVDLHDEIETEKNYLPCIRDFNKGHLRWLRTHDWESSLSAFSAYERLDNIDYVNLYSLAQSLNLTRIQSAFFSVHIYVKHFDATVDYLSDIWIANPHKLKKAFEFIAGHQCTMWKKISDAIFNYA